MWCQEEPKNMGAFMHMLPRLQTALSSISREPKVAYAGRICSASTATGFGSHHAVEQAALIEDALKL